MEAKKIVEKHFGGKAPRVYESTVFYDQKTKNQNESDDINKFDDLDEDDIKIFKILTKLESGRMTTKRKKRLEELEQMGYTKDNFIKYYKNK